MAHNVDDSRYSDHDWRAEYNPHSKNDRSIAANIVGSATRLKGWTRANLYPELDLLKNP